MAEACYAVEKALVGWVIRAGDEAVLICRQKKMAVDTARFAGELLLLNSEICEGEIEPSVAEDFADRHPIGAGTACLRIA
jgi:hypothetical protein